MNLKGCLSHNTDDWRTPSKLYDYLINKLGYIDCFPFKSNVDEFHLDRGNNLRLYANPPFSQLKFVPDWIKHNCEDLHNVVLLLMPARTDTKYFHELLKLNPIIYFIKGRLKFNDSKSAPFPTIMLYFGPKKQMPVYMPMEFVGL